MMLGRVVRVIISARRDDPVRARASRSIDFRVVGIFESGFYELDANWAYTQSAARRRWS